MRGNVFSSTLLTAKLSRRIKRMAGAAEYVNEHTVKAKCRFFAHSQIWPLTVRLDPHSWLTNFTEPEMPHALQLLNSVLYFRSALVDQMFQAAFRSLSRHFLQPRDTYSAHMARWQAFVESAIFTNVTGEQPGPTDSGHAFARRARDLLNISESRILASPDAVRLLARHGAGPVVFVDDFVGSGNQFVETWRRSHVVGPGRAESFRSLAIHNTFGPFFYIPIVCTATGKRNIAATCPAVRVEPAHLVGERYSALDPESVLWPDALRRDAPKFVLEASMRAGIPNDPASTDHYAGFCSLGLALAFEEGCPDATLPLLRWSTNGWKPLFRRAEM